MDIIYLYSSHSAPILEEHFIITVYSKEDVLKKAASRGPFVLLLYKKDVDRDFINAVKLQNENCQIIMLLEDPKLTASYACQDMVDGVFFSPNTKTQLNHNNKSFTHETFKDVLSMEYINDIIFGHPERLRELQPIFNLMDIDLTPHIVLTIIFDNFWTICENRDNAYRYRLKRALLNHTRKAMACKMNGVATSLIGTDKVVALLDCGERCAGEAESYAEVCANRILEVINKQTDFSVSIGISNYCSQPSLLCRAYEQSFRSLENSFQMGRGQILKFHPSLSKINSELSSSIQKYFKRELIIAVSTQNKEQCINTLNDLSARLALQNAGASYTKSLVIVILSEIAKYCVRLGLDSGEISEKIILIVSDLFKADTMNEIKEEALSFLFCLSEKIKSAPSGNGRLDIAKAYIEQYYINNLTLSDIADLCGYSTSYFSRSFKEAFGINFVQYLMQTRLDHAKRLLKETDLGIAEICEKTGFQSISYFSSTFKREVGLTPNQFRLGV